MGCKLRDILLLKWMVEVDLNFEQRFKGGDVVVSLMVISWNNFLGSRNTNKILWYSKARAWRILVMARPVGLEQKRQMGPRVAIRGKGGNSDHRENHELV